MRKLLIVLALVLATCIPAAATDATWAWNLHAGDLEFDSVTTPIPATTLLSTLYNGSNFEASYWRMIGRIEAELDDPKTDPDEPENATWSDITSW